MTEMSPHQITHVLRGLAETALAANSISIEEAEACCAAASIVEKAEAKLRESEAIIQDYLAMSSDAMQELCARAEKAEARVRELERAKLEERDETAQS